MSTLVNQICHSTSEPVLFLIAITLIWLLYNPTSFSLSLSIISLMCGLTERLSSSVSCSSPSSVQFYELRLMFLITALRPELSAQLQQVSHLRQSCCVKHAVQYVLLLSWYVIHHTCFLTSPGGWGVHPHSSLGELPGGPVEGTVWVCAAAGSTAHLSGSFSVYHRDTENPL